MKPATSLYLALLLLGGIAWANTKQPVNIAISLAADTSTSVDSYEYDLQKKGIIAALKDPLVHNMLQSCEHGVAFSYTEFSGATYKSQAKVIVDWFRVTKDNVESMSQEFEAQLTASPRNFTADTDIYKGVELALAQFASLPYPVKDDARVVLVSADGVQNVAHDRMFSEAFTLLNETRAVAKKYGITISGLAILDESDDDTSDELLIPFFERYVITGATAEVTPVYTFKDYARRIVDEILRNLLEHCEPKIS